MAPTTIALPAWASLRPDTPEGKLPIVDVDADAMYRAMLSEYAALYTAKGLAYWTAQVRGKPADSTDGEQAFVAGLEGCNADAPTAYWLEVVYQSMKLDLQLAMKTPAFEIRVHDKGKVWAQKSKAPGRGHGTVGGAVSKAAGGMSGGREAREHYKRLRGFFPG